MVTQPLTAVKRGNLRNPNGFADFSDRGSRPQAQYDAVIAHFRRHPAAWVCGDPFKQERPGQQFKCSFHLSYFDLHGRMCSIWVTPSGRIDDYNVNSDTMFEGEALAVARKHGLFRGGE